MDLISGHRGVEAALEALFLRTFTASEGAQEGAQIAALVKGLLRATDPEEIQVFRAEQAGAVIGALVMTRYHLSQGPKLFLLSPMAVDPAVQGQGLGRALIRFALDHLRQDGVAGVVTYGDPAFYGLTGFVPVTSDQIPVPYPLSQPEGWLVCSLISGAMDGLLAQPLCGPALCAPALKDPVYW